ncbi:hypothetical protein ACLOJK_014546 [Asimina triloba]
MDLPPRQAAVGGRRLMWVDGEDAVGRGERTVCGRTLLDLMREAADELCWIGWVDSHGEGGGGRCCGRCLPSELDLVRRMELETLDGFLVGVMMDEGL